jgi:hypothetical protein
VSGIRDIKKKVEHKEKAYKRANRNTKAPFVNNTAKL